ncbi:MAG: hypothetical protein BAA04_05180, partial [Firmicutes bacterium ZCTH02-B6]
MRVVEKSARTVEEAVAEALRELGANRDDVEVEILEEGSKGLFGLLGAKQAKVRVRLKDAGGLEAGAAGGGSERTGAVMAGAGGDEEDGSNAAWEVDGDLTGDFAEEEVVEEDARPAGPPDETRVARAREFLSGVLDRMEVDAALETRIDDDGTVYINIAGQDLGLIIGRRGQTLDALQFLVNQVANRGEGRRVRIILDAEGYRARRAEALTALARRMAAKARRLRRKVALE